MFLRQPEVPYKFYDKRNLYGNTFFKTVSESCRAEYLYRFNFNAIHPSVTEITAIDKCIDVGTDEWTTKCTKP